VQLPADTDIASVRRKLAYDLCYVRRIGLWLDLRLVCCTALHMAGLPYGTVAWLFALPRPRSQSAATLARLPAPATV